MIIMYTKRLPALVLLLTIFAYAASQNTRQEYILKYQVLAIKEMNRSGIPASITMAQACLESRDGNSELALASNNHFGIKCKASWKGKKVYYDDDEKNECFRSYKVVEDSYRDHTDFLMQNIRYASLFEIHHTDYREWAKGLKKAGYATDSNYDKQLIKIIEEYELYNLDLRWSEDDLANFASARENYSEPAGAILNPYQTRNVEIRNRLKSVVVREGDTFETIAQEFGLKDWELYSFNDYPRGYRPQPNEIIYIQPKKKKSTKSKPTHIAGKGETMHYISQLYGIKLRPLFRRNNMEFGEQLRMGQVVYLRKKKK